MLGLSSSDAEFWVQFGKEQMNQGAFWLVGTKNQQ